MSLDTSLSTAIRTHLLSFLISAFQSLDNGLVRKECAPLVSISIWHNLASESARERNLERNGQLKRAWRASSRRYDAADQNVQARLRFERSWLYSMVLDFFGRLEERATGWWLSIMNTIEALLINLQQIWCTVRGFLNFLRI